MKFNNYKVIGNRVFFTSSFLSNWYTSLFKADLLFSDEVSGVFEFNCVEQFMMAQKAVLFKDYETFIKIMQTESPKEQKALGREVKNYDNKVWVAQREGIVGRGIWQKFLYSDEMTMEMLRFPQGTEFVEASSKDCVWGVGLSMSDPNLSDASQWKGENLLGKVITGIHKEMLLDTEFYTASNG